jgi:Fic family protein
MTMYIHELPDWPHFRWNQEAISKKLAAVRYRQGELIGRMKSMGFSFREEAVFQTLTLDVLKSSEIEGEILNREQVRSSVARHLGMNRGVVSIVARNIEGVVEMTLDATQHYDKPLTKKRLLGWHASLFPTGHSGIRKIKVGAWRDDSKGPMQVVSGRVSRERVHFEAPPASRIEKEMKLLIDWFNKDDDTDLVLRAAIVHLWFVTIHPFEDGNGRIARVLADMLLARSEQSPQRFYSMSAQIQKERDAYYSRLEETQKGTLDISAGLEWFLDCVNHAFDGVEETLAIVLRKARFWESHAGTSINERQRLMLNKMLDGIEGKLTSSKWAKLAKCSQDTALRDILDLMERCIFVKDPAGGRSTSYSLV